MEFGDKESEKNPEQVGLGPFKRLPVGVRRLLFFNYLLPELNTLKEVNSDFETFINDECKNKRDHLKDKKGVGDYILNYVDKHYNMIDYYKRIRFLPNELIKEMFTNKGNGDQLNHCNLDAFFGKYCSDVDCSDCDKKEKGILEVCEHNYEKYMRKDWPKTYEKISKGDDPHSTKYFYTRATIEIKSSYSGFDLHRSFQVTYDMKPNSKYYDELYTLDCAYCNGNVKYILRNSPLTNIASLVLGANISIIEKLDLSKFNRTKTLYLMSVATLTQNIPFISYMANLLNQDEEQELYRAMGLTLFSKNDLALKKIIRSLDEDADSSYLFQYRVVFSTLRSDDPVKILDAIKDFMRPFYTLDNKATVKMCADLLLTTRLTLFVSKPSCSWWYANILSFSALNSNSDVLKTMMAFYLENDLFDPACIAKRYVSINNERQSAKNYSLIECAILSNPKSITSLLLLEPYCTFTPESLKLFSSCQYRLFQEYFYLKYIESSNDEASRYAYVWLLLSIGILAYKDDKSRTEFNQCCIALLGWPNILNLRDKDGERIGKKLVEEFQDIICYRIDFLFFCVTFGFDLTDDFHVLSLVNQDILTTNDLLLTLFQLFCSDNNVFGCYLHYVLCKDEHQRVLLRSEMQDAYVQNTQLAQQRMAPYVLMGFLAFSLPDKYAQDYCYYLDESKKHLDFKEEEWCRQLKDYLRLMCLIKKEFYDSLFSDELQDNFSDFENTIDASASKCIIA